MPLPTSIRRVVMRNPNLLTNGDIETALSGTVNGFLDPFADLNAYVTTGSPTVAANVVTLPSGATMIGGHSEWWDWAAGTQWRFTWGTNTSPTWRTRYIDANNFVEVYLNGTTFTLDKVVGGASTIVQQQAYTPTNGTVYYFVVTISGTTFTVTLQAEVANAPSGTPLSTVTGTIADTTVATGQFMFRNGGTASLTMGGASPIIPCRVVIAAPPSWVISAASGVPAFCVSKTNKFSGTYALSIFNNNIGANGYWQSAAVSVTINLKYTYSARAKKTSVAGTGIRLSSILSLDPGSYVTGTSDWTPLTVANANAASTTAGEAIIAQLNGSGTAWFDLLWLQQVPTLARDLNYSQSAVRQMTSVTPLSTDPIDGASILPVYYWAASTTDPVDSVGVQRVWIVTPLSTDPVDSMSPQRGDVI